MPVARLSKKTHAHTYTYPSGVLGYTHKHVNTQSHKHATVQINAKIYTNKHTNKDRNKHMSKHINKHTNKHADCRELKPNSTRRISHHEIRAT